MKGNDDFFKEQDSRTTSDLIEIALTYSEDDNELWDIVYTLQHRGNYEVFVAAQNLCHSSEPKKRCLGIDILGQLGIPDRTFPEESVQFLLDLLTQEQNVEVLNSIGIAFGHINSPKAVSALVKFKNHPHPDIRYGVTFGLSGKEDNLAVETLIELSTDENYDVRNWATFGLGTQISRDSETIREALFQRLIHEEPESEVYEEALVGLAKRKDERVIEPLLQELTSDNVGTLAIEAAEGMGDVRLYPALIKLKTWWDIDNELLERAISNCMGKTP